MLQEQQDTLQEHNSEFILSSEYWIQNLTASPAHRNSQTTPKRGAAAGKSQLSISKESSPFASLPPGAGNRRTLDVTGGGMGTKQGHSALCSFPKIPEGLQEGIAWCCPASQEEEKPFKKAEMQHGAAFVQLSANPGAPKHLP